MKIKMENKTYAEYAKEDDAAYANYWKELKTLANPWEAAIKMFALMRCQFTVGKDFKHYATYSGIPVVYDESFPDDLILLQTIVKD